MASVLSCNGLEWLAVHCREFCLYWPVLFYGGEMGNKGLLGRNINYEWDFCTGMWMRRNFCPGSRPIEIPNFTLPSTLQCLYQIFWRIH